MKDLLMFIQKLHKNYDISVNIFKVVGVHRSLNIPGKKFLLVEETLSVLPQTFPGSPFSMPLARDGSNCGL